MRDTRHEGATVMQRALVRLGNPPEGYQEPVLLLLLLLLLLLHTFNAP